MKLFNKIKMIGFERLESGVFSIYFEEEGKIKKIEFKAYLKEINKIEKEQLKKLGVK